MTGELAVCAGGCGPGNLHLINGLFDCHRSSTPVLAIAAQISAASGSAGARREAGRATAGSAARASLEMAKGFSLYMVKAIMSGRGDEIIDLAASNLWR